MTANRIDIHLVQLVLNTIAETDSLDMLANQLTQLFVGALGIKGASIFVLNPASEELEVLANAGLSKDYVNKGPILVDKSIRLASNREPVIVMDTEKSDRLQYPKKAKDEGIRAIVSFPVSVRGRIIGALRLYHSKAWEVSDEEVVHLEVMARTMGIALMYFRLATALETVKETVEEIHSVWL